MIICLCFFSGLQHELAYKEPGILTSVAEGAIDVNGAAGSWQFAQHHVQQRGLARTNRAYYSRQ